MPAVTYTPAMRVMNGDYAISGETGVLRGLVLFEKFGFLPSSLKLGVWVSCPQLLSGSLEEMLCLEEVRCLRRVLYVNSSNVITVVF